MRADLANLNYWYKSFSSMLEKSMMETMGGCLPTRTHKIPLFPAAPVKKWRCHGNGCRLGPAGLVVADEGAWVGDSTRRFLDNGSFPKTKKGGEYLANHFREMSTRHNRW